MMEKIQEHVLHFIYNDYESVYVDLLQMSSKHSLFIGHLKRIVQKKCKIMNLSPIFLKELFTKKMVSYNLRNDYALDIQRCDTAGYGINSLCYQGMKLCGSLEGTIKNRESIVERKRLRPIFMSMEGSYL